MIQVLPALASCPGVPGKAGTGYAPYARVEQVAPLGRPSALAPLDQPNAWGQPRR